MIITGGRSKSISEIIQTEVYDTENSEWNKLSGLGLFRHSCFIKDNFLYVYGGFENSNPNIPVEKILKIDLLQYFISNNNLLSKLDNHLASIANELRPSSDRDNSINNNQLRINNLVIDNAQKQDQKFRLSNQAVVVKFGEGNFDDMGFIRKVSIDKLNDEAKRIGYSNNRPQINNRRVYDEDLINKFIEVLLRPFDWYKSEMDEIHNKLPFTNEEIESLINEAAKVIVKDASLVRLRSPAKIFGNLNGQYNDLMRFFESFGHPSDENMMGDIHLLQYVFLGDICDRGHYSLEVVFLLLALKVNFKFYLIG